MEGYEEIEIENEDIFQFELTTETSLFYNIKENTWYLQTEEEVEDNIFIVEDKEEEIYLVEDIEIFDCLLTITDFESYKEIVASELEQ